MTEPHMLDVTKAQEARLGKPRRKFYHNDDAHWY